MAYGGGMGYHLHMPSYFWRTFTEYPSQGGEPPGLKDISVEIFSKCYQPANSYTKSCELVGFFVSFPLLYSSEKNGCLLHLSDKHPNKIVKVRNTLFSLLAYKQPGIFIFQIFP